MSEPIIDLGIGFLFALLLAFGTLAAVRMRASRSAVLRLNSTPPPVMTVIEADMDQVHSQIAVATRRLEICVEQMKSKTTNQLAEIGKTSETIARLKAELAERTAVLAALQDKERAVGAQLRTTAAELAAKLRSLEETEQKLADRKAEFDRFVAQFDLHPELAKAQSRHAAAMSRVPQGRQGFGRPDSSSCKARRGIAAACRIISSRCRSRSRPPGPRSAWPMRFCASASTTSPPRSCAWRSRSKG